MSHNCQPPSVDTARFTCKACGREWVASGGGWRSVPEFVPMTAAEGAVSIRVNDGHPVHGKD